MGMNIKRQIIAIVFLIVVLGLSDNASYLEMEGELQKPLFLDRYVPTSSALDVSSYAGESLASTDLAVPKAEVQRKRIPITLYGSSSLISSFVGEVTISRDGRFRDYKIVTEAEDYAPDSYIAGALIRLVDPTSQVPLASFGGTIMRTRQEHIDVYHLLTSNDESYVQDFWIEVEIGQRRPVTLPQDEVKTLSPPDSTIQAASSQNTVLDTSYRNSTGLWVAMIVVALGLSRSLYPSLLGK